MIFYNFLELHSTLSVNYFCQNFYFFNGFTQTIYPLNSQNLLSVTKVFCRFSLKCLLIFFSNICWQNPAKTSFMYQQWTATVHIFYKLPTVDSLVFFSEHFSRTAFLTQTSEFFLYWFYMFSFYYFIFHRLIWKAITVYFLWFHHWVLKEWKATKVENHSVSAY